MMSFAKRFPPADGTPTSTRARPCEIRLKPRYYNTRGARSSTARAAQRARAGAACAPSPALLKSAAQEVRMAADRDKIFIKMGLENKYIDDAQVKKGKEYQAQQRVRGVDMTIGEALMDLKLINKTQYLTIQRAANYKIQRSSDKVLARILIESDYAPKQEVLDAMAWQKEHYTKDGVCRPVGDLLIERGFLTVEQLKAAQKIQALKGEDEE
jgi:hypothetical protein